MRFRYVDWKSCALVAAALLLVGCGDDEPAGPEFGDLLFSPSSPNIGADRQVELDLSNVSGESRGPIMIGAGSIPLSVPRGSTCPELDVAIDPGQIQSMAAGGSVQVTVDFSFAGLSVEQCPLATYDVDINAALGSTVLESARVRLDHTALE